MMGQQAVSARAGSGDQGEGQGGRVQDPEYSVEPNPAKPEPKRKHRQERKVAEKSRLGDSSPPPGPA